MRYVTRLLSSILVVLMVAVPAYGLDYFTQDFEVDNWDHTDWDPSYNFVSGLFGYGGNPIQETWNDWVSYGHPDGAGGSHNMPLHGMTDLNQNFEVHLSPTALLDQDEMYARYCYWITDRLPNDGENWKLSYNYSTGAAGSNGFVFWLHARVADGREPSFYNGQEAWKTEAVATWYQPDYEEEWTCFEYYTNFTTNAIKLWITTELGAYNDTLYIDTTMPDFGNTIEGIKMGSYWDGQEIDHFIVNSQIGTTDTDLDISCPTGNHDSGNASQCGDNTIDKYQVGDVITIDSEDMQVTGHTASNTMVTASRGYNSTTPTIHSSSTVGYITSWVGYMGFLMDEIIIADSKIGPLSTSESATVSKSIGGGSLGGGSW